MRFLTYLLFFVFAGLGVCAQQKGADSACQKKNGIASYYHNKFCGRKTASGDVFSNKGYTAASNKFALGTYVKVTNQQNGNCIYVVVNDRMAKHNKRIIDLTLLAAEKLDFKARGTVDVKVEEVTEAEGKAAIQEQSEPVKEAQRDSEA